MRKVLAISMFAIVAAVSCGKPEWVIPHSGEAACMCKMICACEGISQSEETLKERARCADACGCDACETSGTANK